jgi:hypothetical protein
MGKDGCHDAGGPEICSVDERLKVEWGGEQVKSDAVRRSFSTSQPSALAAVPMRRAPCHPAIVVAFACGQIYGPRDETSWQGGQVGRQPPAPPRPDV